MKLQCKNCGGSITYNESKQMLMCEFCGKSQPVDEAVHTIYVDTDGAGEAVSQYHKARALMREPSEPNLLRAAAMLEDIAGVLNADELAVVCRQKADAMKKERQYGEAVAQMEQGDGDGLIAAVALFSELGDYRDCAMRLDECRRLLEEESKLKERRRLTEERQKRKERSKRRMRSAVFISLVAAVCLLALVIYFSAYSPDNVKIEVEPADEFITAGYNDYDLHFEVTARHTGRADIQSLKADVIFEDEDREIVLDASLQLYNYSTPVLRGGSTHRFDWTVTTKSEKTARFFDETDFEDIDVHIEITEIVYADGERKTY